jgi:hypothetical protein
MASSEKSPAGGFSEGVNKDLDAGRRAQAELARAMNPPPRPTPPPRAIGASDAATLARQAAAGRARAQAAGK